VLTPEEAVKQIEVLKYEAGDVLFFRVDDDTKHSEMQSMANEARKILDASGRSPSLIVIGGSGFELSFLNDATMEKYGWVRAGGVAS